MDIIKIDLNDDEDEKKDVKETDKYIFFWDGVFSQWYQRDMIIDGIKYGCCEQYMMSEKARLFKDENSKQLILDCNSPYLQKRLGRGVKNFDEDKWNKVCRHIVYVANKCKFSQHKDLRDILLKTGSKEIVEASPHDCIWGVGLRSDDDKILDKKNWKGTNWLGEELMNVRESLAIDDLFEQTKEHNTCDINIDKIFNNLN